MGNLYTPNGTLIVGTADVLNAVAGIRIGSIQPNRYGQYDLIYDGGSDVDWDSQVQRKSTEGQLLYVDEDGDEWAEGDLTYKEDDGDA